MYQYTVICQNIVSSNPIVATTIGNQELKWVKLPMLSGYQSFFFPDIHKCL